LLSRADVSSDVLSLALPALLQVVHGRAAENQIQMWLPQAGVHPGLQHAELGLLRHVLASLAVAAGL
jgi:hypothetical protein